MAETDVLYKFGWEPGFSCSVYNPDSSPMLHWNLYEKILSLLSIEKMFKSRPKIILSSNSTEKISKFELK